MEDLEQFVKTLLTFLMLQLSADSLDMEEVGVEYNFVTYIVLVSESLIEILFLILAAISFFVSY